MTAPEPITRRAYLTLRAMQAGADLFVAMEAVASTAIEHPEWDMDLKRTYAEWEQRAGRRR